MPNSSVSRNSVSSRSVRFDNEIITAGCGSNSNAVHNSASNVSRSVRFGNETITTEGCGSSSNGVLNNVRFGSETTTAEGCGSSNRGVHSSARFDREAITAAFGSSRGERDATNEECGSRCRLSSVMNAGAADAIATIDGRRGTYRRSGAIMAIREITAVTIAVTAGTAYDGTGMAGERRRGPTVIMNHLHGRVPRVRPAERREGCDAQSGTAEMYGGRRFTRAIRGVM